MRVPREHSRTVGAYARQTAATLGLAPDRVERLHAAGVVHDLGKLGIADAILHKPAALDDGEWREMRRHPEIGARILEHAGLHDIAGWVRAHHERIDGRGYPDRLRAAGVPLEARILAVADAYEAMVADRPYRRGLEPAAARAELLRGAGTQFDAEVVDAFLRTLDDAALAPLAPPQPSASQIRGFPARCQAGGMRGTVLAGFGGGLHKRRRAPDTARPVPVRQLRAEDVPVHVEPRSAAALHGLGVAARGRGALTRGHGRAKATVTAGCRIGRRRVSRSPAARPRRWRSRNARV